MASSRASAKGLAAADAAPLACKPCTSATKQPAAKRQKKAPKEERGYWNGLSGAAEHFAKLMEGAAEAKRKLEDAIDDGDRERRRAVVVADERRKARVKAMCESFGGKVTGSVSGRTDVLIVGKHWWDEETHGPVVFAAAHAG